MLLLIFVADVREVVGDLVPELIDHLDSNEIYIYIYIYILYTHVHVHSHVHAYVYIYIYEDASSHE